MAQGITFSNTVGNAQGIFIADGIMKINNATSGIGLERQFVGEGVFVGWNGVSLNRDLDSVDTDTDNLANNTNPAEQFVYRPDFIINAPNSFKRSGIQWQEVAP